MIAIVNTGSGGGGSSIPAPTAGNMAVTTDETTGAFSIPANCLWVQIRNAGMVKDGDTESEATVGGEAWSVGRQEKYEAVWDAAAGEYLRLPAISGNGNGSRVFISYAL